MFDVGVVFVEVDDATVPVVVLDVVFMGFSAPLLLCVSIFHRYFPFRERAIWVAVMGGWGFKKHFSI